MQKSLSKKIAVAVVVKTVAQARKSTSNISLLETFILSKIYLNEIYKYLTGIYIFRYAIFTFL